MSGKKISSAKKFAKGGTTCLQCGDLGYDIALIFCDKCKEYAVHRYCLDRLPSTFAEDVVWCCDDCDPILVEKQLCDEQPSSAMSEEKDFINTEITQPVEPKRKPKKKKSLYRVRKRKEEKKKKMQQREKEKVAAAVAARERETIGKTGEDFTVTAKDEELKEKGGTTPDIIDDSLFTVEGQDNRGEVDSVLEKERSSKGDAQSTMTSLTPAPTKTPITKPNIIDESLCTVKGKYNGGEFDSDLEEERNCRGDVQATTTSPMATPVYLEVSCSTERAWPILNPIWRGSLSVNSLAFSRVGRVVAHVSTLACSKVSEEARLFPQLLCSDLYPRLSVWPKGFEKWGPTDDSIALFLFPEDETNEKVFESLLSEMIRGDFALKAVVTNAELLVFTSIKLPLHLWKINGKFFLWGVFRGKLPSSDLSNAAVSRSEDVVKDVNWMTSCTNPLSIR